MLGVGIEKSTDHPLVLGVVLLSLRLEELNAALAQSDRHLYAFVPKDEILRPWKKVRNDLRTSEGFVCVFYFRAHKSAFLSANIPHRKCE